MGEVLMTVCGTIAAESASWDKIPTRRESQHRHRLRRRRCELDKYMVMQAVISAIHDGYGWSAAHGGAAWDSPQQPRYCYYTERYVETEVAAVIAIRAQGCNDREGKVLVQAGVGRADAKGITKGGALLAALRMEPDYGTWWRLANGLGVDERPQCISPTHAVEYWRVGLDYNYALHALTAALA